MADHKAPKIPELFLEDESKALSEASSQVCQFPATRYPANLQYSMVVALDELRDMDVPTSRLDGESNFTRGPYLGSWASVLVWYGHFSKICSVIAEFVPSSMADVISLAICGGGEDQKSIHSERSGGLSRVSVVIYQHTARRVWATTYLEKLDTWCFCRRTTISRALSSLCRESG